MKEESLPVTPFPSESEILQEFESPQAQKVIDIYFRHLPNSAKAWIPVTSTKFSGS